jgi:two-component system OmpR family sensor kinase
MKSIQAKLLFWAIGGLVAGVAVALWATYLSVRAEIKIVFDGELKQVAHAVHLREDWVQLGRVRIARPGFSLAVRAYDASGRVYFHTAFPELPPDAPQTLQPGYGYMNTADGAWRIYTHVTPEGILQVGQPVATRDALARNLAFRSLVPLLVLIPVIVVLLAWVLARGLSPLRETSHLVSQRDAACLDSLPTQGVPSELLPLVQQINALLTRLSASLDGQRRFLEDVAHELRSPVAALALQAQLAERASNTAARRGAFGELRQGIERVGRLVQQLLNFARLDPGLELETRVPIDLAGLARDVVASHAARADQAGIDLGADTEPTAWVTGSQSELCSMLVNLVENALRYSRAGGTITVSVRQNQERMIELCVIDDGPGIPPEERERVFQRFHRVPGDRTSGSGLGLSIVKAIVMRHGGTLFIGDAHPGADRPGLLVRVLLRPAQLPEAVERDLLQAAA